MSRPNLGWSGVVVSFVATEVNKKYEGKSIAEIAKGQYKDVFDALFDLLIEENADAHMIIFSWSEEGVRKVMHSSAGMVASDGSSLCNTGPLSSGKPHPRNYGNFVRILAEYVREFLPKEKGIIWEQEAYMEKLDANLFQRYRKKRKPIV